MGEETEQFKRKPTEEGISAFGHTMSVRAVLALSITFTGCFIILAPVVNINPGIAVPSDYMVMWGMVLTFYFKLSNA